MSPGQEETPKRRLWWGWGGIKAKTRLLGTPPPHLCHCLKGEP